MTLTDFHLLPPRELTPQPYSQSAALKEAKEEIKRTTAGHQELSLAHTEAKERRNEVARRLSSLEARHKDLEAEHDLTKVSA